ncbi:MAG TPA: endolytic transglycosylase MltG [Patescibacteria group bacterium]|nr:endolytic transglycosylase MltG [Patescibacteria group bacterium]
MKKHLIFVIIIVAVIFVAAFSVWSIFMPVADGRQIDSQTREVFFNVEKGEGSREIALNLEKEKLISWGPLFRIYVLFKGIAGELKAGQYLLSPSMNIPQIAEKLFQGEVLKEKITVIEGWNLKDISWYFENKGMFLVEEVRQIAAKDFSGDFDFLADKPAEASLEGYLFPDTYEIRKEESLEDIVGRMLNNFDKKLTVDLREEIKKQEKSIFKIITMASLIEKEVRTPADKRLVSGILWKRLAINMPLQVDATIAYILGIGTGSWDFDEMRKEVALQKEIDSPYNTYKYRGLPLGPIANPGLESIKASIYPEDSDYWYYLSTAGGQTFFSETLTDHNIKKAEYLR